MLQGRRRWPQQQFCPGCFALIPADAAICPACGQTIAAVDPADYREKLLRALHHPLSEVRMRAIIALGWRGEIVAVSALIECALHHPTDVIEGLEIVRSLRQIETKTGDPRGLLVLAERHPARAVRAAAHILRDHPRTPGANEEK